MKFEYMRLRIPSDLKAWLQAKAEDEGRSMNAQIVQAIKATISADQPQKENAK